MHICVHTYILYMCVYVYKFMCVFGYTYSTVHIWKSEDNRGIGLLWCYISCLSCLVSFQEFSHHRLPSVHRHSRISSYVSSFYVALEIQTHMLDWFTLYPLSHLPRSHFYFDDFTSWDTCSFFAFSVECLGNTWIIALVIIIFNKREMTYIDHHPRVFSWHCVSTLFSAPMLNNPCTVYLCLWGSWVNLAS